MSTARTFFPGMLTARRLCVMLVLAALLALGERPAAWAVKMTVAGVPNLHKLNDGVYRSAQPTAEGFRELEKMGIRTVICLRGTDADSELCKGTALKVEHVGMLTIGIDEDDIAQVLRILCDKDRQPCLVHCLHGADRTGTMCAAYRRCVEGWSGEEAAREMTDGGYGFHSIWFHLPRKVKSLDVKGLCEKMSAAPTETRP